MRKGRPEGLGSFTRSSAGLNNLAMAAYLRGKPQEAQEYLSRLESAYQDWGETEKAMEIQQKISNLSVSAR